MLRSRLAAVVCITSQTILLPAFAEEQDAPPRTFSIEVVKPDATVADAAQLEFPSGPTTETQTLALPMPEDDQAD